MSEATLILSQIESGDPQADLMGFAPLTEPNHDISDRYTGPNSRLTPEGLATREL